jgi:hypothetical protein
MLGHFMPTLVINAPSYQQAKRSFSKTMTTGVGDDYALNSKILPLAQKARDVILLDKTARKKATGTISKIVATGNKTRSGIPRFDIHMANLKECDYKPESLNRNGVAII